MLHVVSEAILLSDDWPTKPEKVGWQPPQSAEEPLAQKRNLHLVYQFGGAKEQKRAKGCHDHFPFCRPGAGYETRREKRAG